MRRRLFYVALAVIVLNGLLLVCLFGVALAHNTVNEVRIPASLLIAAIIEGVVAIVIADGRWTAKASEKTRRREYHRYVCEMGKAFKRPVSYQAYCTYLTFGNVTALLGDEGKNSEKSKTVLEELDCRLIHMVYADLHPWCNDSGNLLPAPQPHGE